MRKIFISAFLLCAGMFANAQLLKVSTVEKVALPADAKVSSATMSPDGNFVVLSYLNRAGLDKFDLNTKKSTQISVSGSSYDLKISSDSKSVIFRESVVKPNRMRYTALKGVDLALGKEIVLVDATRNLQGFNVVGANVSAVENGRLKARNLMGTRATSVPVASIDKGQLCITVNGKTTVISPQGQEGQSYLWPSVSPDGTKVAYYLAAKGCYVCNIDGSNPVYLGILRAPKWYNEEIIVGMRDHDNGHFVTESAVYASAIDGSEEQLLTDKSVMAMYPSANAEGSKVAFTTPNGDLYIIHVTTAK